MKLIQQTKPNTCLACVLAMIVEETEQYVLDWFQFVDPPFRVEHAFIFLAHHGIFLNIGGNLTDEQGKGKNIEGINPIDLRIDMRKNPAYLVVESKVEGLDHAVFWDCEHVLDPKKKEPQPLGEYKVKYIFPMMPTERRFQLKNLRVYHEN